MALSYVSEGFNRTVKMDWLGVGRAFARRSVKDDFWATDMSRQGGVLYWNDEN